MLKLPILQKMAWNCSKVRAARAARTARTARLFFPTLPIKFLIVVLFLSLQSVMLNVPIISCCLCYLQSMIIATILQLARVIPRAVCLVVDQSDRGVGVSYSCD